MNKITVPLRLISLQDDGFHLLVEIVVFGEKHLMVVDTGASRTVFDQSLLRKHAGQLLIEEEEQSDEHQATTLFSTSNTFLVTFPRLRLGKLKLKNYKAVGLDLQSVNDTYAQLGHPIIAGILGGDILLQYHAKINYKKLSLKLYN